jgi:hypothetical protein
MSLSHEVVLECLTCHVPMTVVAIASFNPNRYPGFKDQLLDGTLNRYPCVCGATLVADVEVLYLDNVRRQMFMSFPRGRIAELTTCLAEARRAFERGFGEHATAGVQAIGRELMLRVCFGLDELRDKVIADEAELSDLALEELKCRILDERDDLRELQVLHLALARVTPDTLEFTSQGPDGVRTPRVTVERARYTEIAALGHDAIVAARPSLVHGPHVSMLGVAHDT